jgi:membrane protein YdbS with pleckstrin-like domain
VAAVPLPRKFLNDDEELLVEMRPHWVFMAGPLAATAGVAAAVAALLLGVSSFTPTESYFFLALILIPGVWLIGRAIRWSTYLIALTTTRIVLRHGVLNRDTVQLRLQRITEINIAQALWERALGTGRLIIDVQGEDDSMILEYVRKPAIVQRVINSQINELVGGGTAEPIPEEFRPRNPSHGDRTTPPEPPPRDPDPFENRQSRRRPDDTPPFGVPAFADHEADDEHEPVPASAAPSAPLAGVPAGASHADIRDRLIELDDLRQRGIISNEEFAAKKAELLNRI